MLHEGRANCAMGPNEEEEHDHLLHGSPPTQLDSLIISPVFDEPLIEKE